MKKKLKIFICVLLFFVLFSIDFSTVSARCRTEQYNCQRKYGTVICDEREVCDDEDETSKECSGIKLNTNFPIIGNCIEYKSDKENPTNAFPYMIGALTKIIMSLILVVCFIFIIVAGIMWAGAGEDNGQVTKAKGILKKVAIVILLLGFSGAILRLINPTFFS